VDWERRDTDAMLGYFTDDAVSHCRPLAPLSGKAARAEWVRGFEGTPPARSRSTTRSRRTTS
jgi:hypothetical protein